MVRTHRPRPEAEDAYTPAEAERIKEQFLRAYQNVIDAWGLSGLRDGLLGCGWTDEDMCWVIDHFYLEKRCEVGALAIEGRRRGLATLGPAAFRAACEADAASRPPPAPLWGGETRQFQPVPPPPDAAERAEAERAFYRLARRRPRDRRAGGT